NHAWAWYLGVTGVLTAAYLFFPPLAGNGPLINFLGLTGVVAIVAGIRINKPKARAAWWLFVLGQFLFFSGDLYTYSYPKLFHADVGFPSLGDGLYLTVYPALLAGMLLLVKRRNPRRDPAALIDAAILTIGVGLLSWVFLISPNIHLSGLSWLAKSVSIAYPIRFAQELGNPDVLVLIIASAFLFLLVVARMAGLVRQEGRVVSRERALRGAGIDLVAAASHEQVCEAAIAGVRRLLGDDQSVRLALVGNDDAQAFASSDCGGWQLAHSTAICLSQIQAG